MNQRPSHTPHAPRPRRRGLPRARHATQRATRLLTSILATATLCALALAGAASPAGAALAPTVSTGGAQAVSYGSAILTGSVNPNGANTSFYFQYGLTKGLYGSQTTIADAGSGAKAETVKLAIAGLQPLTLYHYRLVAVSSAGPSEGGDHTFMTTKVPLSLAILASPNPVTFGSPVVVQGTLSGTESANRPVALQADPFPFDNVFSNVGNTVLTTATGGFTFTLLNASTSTQYRVVTVTNPPVISPVAIESVAVKVVSHVGRARRHGFVRVYGTVSPAQDGAQVGILRIVGGRGVLAGGTILTHGSATSSRFSRVVRAHHGIYRVLVRVASGPLSSAYGQPLAIG